MTLVRRGDGHRRTLCGAEVSDLMVDLGLGLGLGLAQAGRGKDRRARVRSPAALKSKDRC